MIPESRPSMAFQFGRLLKTTEIYLETLERGWDDTDQLKALRDCVADCIAYE